MVRRRYLRDRGDRRGAGTRRPLEEKETEIRASSRHLGPQRQRKARDGGLSHQGGKGAEGKITNSSLEGPWETTGVVARWESGGPAATGGGHEKSAARKGALPLLPAGSWTPGAGCFTFGFETEEVARW